MSSSILSFNVKHFRIVVVIAMIAAVFVLINIGRGGELTRCRNQLCARCFFQDKRSACVKPGILSKFRVSKPLSWPVYVAVSIVLSGRVFFNSHLIFVFFELFQVHELGGPLPKFVHVNDRLLAHIVWERSWRVVTMWWGATSGFRFRILRAILPNLFISVLRDSTFSCRILTKVINVKECCELCSKLHNQGLKTVYGLHW